MPFILKRNLDRNSRAILFLALVGTLLVCVASCGDDDPAEPGTGTPENSVQNELTFTRQNGTPLMMGAEFAICCGAWEPGYDESPTLKIFFYDPLLWTDPNQAESFWKLFIVMDKLGTEQAYDFPTTSESPLRMFLYDTASRNEVSGEEEESSGTITIERLNCGPPVRIKFTIDAVLGSEYHMGSTVTVTGTFTATVYTNPSSLGCDFAM